MVAHCINALLDRNKNLDPNSVEDIIMGCGNPEGPTGHNIGRNAVVLSNLPISTSGTTVIGTVLQVFKLFLWQQDKLWLAAMMSLWQEGLSK